MYYAHISHESRYSFVWINAQKDVENSILDSELNSEVL